MDDSFTLDAELDDDFEDEIDRVVNELCRSHPDIIKKLNEDGFVVGKIEVDGIDVEYIIVNDVEEN